ncbi:RmlC-like cupin [Dothidotthia symphoricarpi CBS 119687]|uniref:RmlC-like cupin n=1 Tax=Dothidotthia symphoricarpi CBS 119687 TaxID=1392245 RepID=A0A6A6AVN2_9PLEO|nr:RmlC-like cupin [Dothidotthia symphoricarpi CBS 119687]KAF2134591.1 RmlC-like cupin [Dothidotthia symphoricarpi CBS 119687]
MFTPLTLLALLLPLTHASKSRTVNPDLNAQLLTAATNYDRNTLLPADSDWYYDFFKHPYYNSTVGSVIAADAATFPALAGQGISISLLTLGPCSMLPPHLHPRATNLVTAISGNTTSYMIGENGVRTVKVNLIPMRMTIFPRASLHVMQNNGCEPSVLISALNSEDSGTLNILNSLWTIPRDIIQAAFGNAGLDTEDLGESIPDVGTGAVAGSAECKLRCGIA